MTEDKTYVELENRIAAYYGQAVASTPKEAILYGYSKSFTCDAFGLTEEEYWLERRIALYTPIPLTTEDLKSIYCVREAEPKEDLAPWRSIPHKRGRAKRNRR